MKKIIIDGVDVSGCEHFWNGYRPYCKCYNDELCTDYDYCYYKQLKRMEQTTEPTEETCPHCDNTIELPPHLGIYECPECGELIIACSMCVNHNCNSCKYVKLTDDGHKIKDLEQENARLKEEINRIGDMRICYEENLKLCKWQERRISKLATALQKIEEIAEHYIKGCVDCSLIAEPYECEDCTDGGMAKLGKQILQKISKVEVQKDE